MLEELQRRNYAKTTVYYYLKAVERFAKFFHTSPDQLNQSPLRQYQAYLLRERKLGPRTVKLHVSALRFFFVKTLKRPYLLEDIPFPKVPRRLPGILTTEEVARLIDGAKKLTDRTMLMVLYSTGMRNAELRHLQVRDIDSRRMLIHIQHGKGGRDRYVPLSATLLATLRVYYRWMRPKTWLFPGTIENWRADKPLTPKGGGERWGRVSRRRGARSPRETRLAPSASPLVRLASGGSGSGPADRAALARARQTRAHGHLSAFVAAASAGGGQSSGCDTRLRRRHRAPHAPAPQAVTRPPFEVANIVRQHGDRFLETHQAWVTGQHRRVFRAIARCRTAALGGHRDRCDQCAHLALSYNSCRDRHCPKCLTAARNAWVAAREQELLPVGYVHLVFTVPEPLARLALDNKRVVYDLLFRTAAATLLQVAANPKRLGATIGGLMVLHTWGQRLQHHPHVHCVVPMGSLSPEGTRWIHARPRFFLPIPVLRQVFRGKRLAGGSGA